MLRKYFSDSRGDVLKNNDRTTMDDDLVIASSIRLLASARLHCVHSIFHCEREVTKPMTTLI